MRTVLVIICLASCGKAKDDHAASAGANAPATPPTPATAPSGGTSDCKKTVQLCKEIAAAHVDALCGTQSPNTVPDSVAGEATVDGCSYNAANNGNNVQVARMCFTGERSAELTRMAFKSTRDKPARESTATDVGGIGDEAYVMSAPYGYRQLWVRNGNTVISIARPGRLAPEAEDAMRKDCLIALYREVLAKY